MDRQPSQSRPCVNDTAITVNSSLDFDDHDLSDQVLESVEPTESTMGIEVNNSLAQLPPLWPPTSDSHLNPRDVLASINTGSDINPQDGLPRFHSGGHFQSEDVLAGINSGNSFAEIPSVFLSSEGNYLHSDHLLPHGGHLNPNSLHYQTPFNNGYFNSVPGHEPGYVGSVNLPSVLSRDAAPSYTASATTQLEPDFHSMGWNDFFSSPPGVAPSHITSAAIEPEQGFDGFAFNFQPMPMYGRVDPLFGPIQAFQQNIGFNTFPSTGYTMPGGSLYELGQAPGQAQSSRQDEEPPGKRKRPKQTKESPQEKKRGKKVQDDSDLDDKRRELRARWRDAQRRCREKKRAGRYSKMRDERQVEESSAERYSKIQVEKRVEETPEEDRGEDKEKDRSKVPSPYIGP